MDKATPNVTPNVTPKAGLGVLGVGAAACVACCAGPILGFLAATGIASVLGAVTFGVAGLLVVLAVAAVVWQRRRHRARQCGTATGPCRSTHPSSRPRSPSATSDQPPTAVARFRCTGTHRGPWQGRAPTGRTMNIDEVYFYRTDGDRLTRAWGLEDTWTVAATPGGSRSTSSCSTAVPVAPGSDATVSRHEAAN